MSEHDFAQPQEPRLRVDFNNVTDDDLIRAYRRLGTPDPAMFAPGMNVVLYDGEGSGDGNRCLGVIKKADAKIVLVEPIWSTWIDGKPVTEPSRVDLSQDLIMRIKKPDETMAIPDKKDLAAAAG